MKYYHERCSIIGAGLFFLGVLYAANAYAAVRVVNLTIADKSVNFTGATRQALAINNQIPAPTLHFQEGDQVTINVTNHLDQGTSIHWHGLIVPWQMDGVAGVSQQPIAPGAVFHYQFTLHQSGTYWYHAHTGLQEQQGLYGAIIVDPRRPPHYHYNKDQVIVLSDWSDTSANQIYANLKKQGDYYASEFPLQPSLLHFIKDYRQASLAQRKKLLSDYHMMQTMRMSIYDISDVAYDAFLLNGQANGKPWNALVKPGDVVRLRFIDAAADTIFHVKVPGAKMRVVQMQGHDIKPYEVKDFSIAPGETLDALVKIQGTQPTIIYAESADTLGAAYGALITHPQQKVDYQSVKPFAVPQPVAMSEAMPGMSHMAMPGMTSSHTMANMIMSDMSPQDKAQTTGTKYQQVVSPYVTNDPHQPVTVIKMELSGYMDRFIWFINGVPEYKAKPIIIEPGKRYRLIFINQSMMHHPMHIHGHWFILRNGHGAYDPLLHTIDVPPGATVVADIDANASGQWIFHCHFLYHMMAGMGRVFRYSTFPQDAKSIATPSSNSGHDAMLTSDHPMTHPPSLFAANFFDVGDDAARNIQRINFKSLIGGDYQKLELNTVDAEIKQGTVETADMDIFYWHLISQFWAVKGGMNYVYRPAAPPYWQPGVGIEGLMPYFIDTDVRSYYHGGSAKLDIQFSRDTQISQRFYVRLGVRSILATKSITNDQIGSGLNQIQYTLRPYYQIKPDTAVFMAYDHTQSYGALKNILIENGQSPNDNSLTLGLAFLF